MAHISLLSNVRLTGLMDSGMMAHTNQHDHVLCSNAWSCFSFRATNQHDHVLRSNAWSCFSFRTINHMTMSFVVMLGHVYFSGMRPVGPGCVSGQDTLLKLPSTNHVCFCSL